jgi:hypothetical protein
VPISRKVLYPINADCCIKDLLSPKLLKGWSSRLFFSIDNAFMVNIGENNNNIHLKDGAL